MGLYRFLLSISVVWFHFGGGPWTLGRSAVFAFYTVSGFLIARVLDQLYLQERNGLLRFYLNRLLRLAPLYLVVMLVMYALILWRDSTYFSINGLLTAERFPLVSPAILKYGITTSDWLFPRTPLESGLPVLSFSPNLIPQGWSIGIEVSFYFLAPLVILLFRRGGGGLANAGCALAFMIYAFTFREFRDLDNWVYKNFIPSALFFVIGIAFYWIRKNLKLCISYKISICVLTIYAVWALGYQYVRVLAWGEPNPAGFYTNIFLTLPVSAAIFFTQVPESMKMWDRKLGDLSYGIYINHFLVAAALLTVAGSADKVLFGRVNQVWFGLWTILGSVLLAMLTYRLVEAPIDSLRAKVRRPSENA